MSMTADQKRAHLSMCMSIKNALDTPNGQILKQWLKKTCFMDNQSPPADVESTARLYRVNAWRDLYITLENIIQEGNSYVSNPDE